MYFLCSWALRAKQHQAPCMRECFENVSHFFCMFALLRQGSSNDAGLSGVVPWTVLASVPDMSGMRKEPKDSAEERR